MQKLFHIIFLVFYGTFALGVNINLHYCLDTIKDIHVTYFSGDGSCEAAEEDPCCADEASQEEPKEESQPECCFYETYSLNIDEQQENTNFRLAFTAANNSIERPKIVAVPKANKSYTHKFIPPPTPIFLRDCRLTFYG